jgi:protein-S-isoprenylcysteine O-methyltransferase Ste14
MSSQTAAQLHVDPRGLRFAAAVTTVVLALTLVLNNAWPLAIQAVVFAISVAFGVQASPYGQFFKRLIRPRLGPPKELEDAAPPRFAQLVGLVFAVIGLIGYLAGVEVLGVVATGLALVAAFVNAAVGLCLGCEAYLLIQRIRTPNTATTT